MLENFFFALSLKTSEAIKFLKSSLNKGAHINAADANGRTLLHHVCKENHDFELFLFLLNNGAATNIIDKDGKTPLQYAYDNQQNDSFENLSDAQKIPLHIRDDIIRFKKYTKAVYVLRNFTTIQDMRYVFFKTGVLGNTNQVAAIITYVKNKDNTASIFVAFRGSRTLNDVAVDSVAVQLTVDTDNGHIFPDKFHGPDNFIYYGFLWRYKALSNEIRYHIRDLLITKNCSLDTTKFYFTGHSLGGALANICAIDMQNHFQIKRSNTYLVSFSAPRVFSKNMAKEVAKCISPASYRFFMIGDPFVTMPPESMGWGHVGTLIQVKRSATNIGSTAVPKNMGASLQKISHQMNRHLHYTHSMERLDASFKKAFEQSK
ncbi:MAG: ankyrin repeat domain-containing protein [Candidatus Paracaedibacteraceae bacterium]|nr:ankyrin repeat domain-containing protein [Candidatus Paracaedibacteraceae bacterium]